MFDVGEIHKAAEFAGLPVRSVRSKGGVCEIIMLDTATEEQRAEAEKLAKDVTEASERGDTHMDIGGEAKSLTRENVMTITDALVILSVHPDDKEATKVRDIYYARLRG